MSKLRKKSETKQVEAWLQKAIFSDITQDLQKVADMPESEGDRRFSIFSTIQIIDQTDPWA